MAIRIINEYRLGDMTARYLTEEKEETGGAAGRTVGLQLLPGDMPACGWTEAQGPLDSLCQLKLTGDIYSEAYAMGNTMRNSETVRRLCYKGQRSRTESGILYVDTKLEDEERGYMVIHHLRWKEGTPYVKIWCTFENHSQETCSLEMFESFSLGGLSPYLPDDGHGSLYVHRIRGVWSAEGRHEELPVEELQLEPAWGPQAVRCERFGQAGSMPVNKYFPFAAVEDRKSKVFWGAQIAHPASWQMELYRKVGGLCLSGGLADRESGHWIKDVEPGEAFDTPAAIVTTAHTDSFDVFTGRLTEEALEHTDERPDTEIDLPIIFNEYCTTWGNPSHENIARIVERIRGKGFRYFVIDCGWYKESGVPWDISMGDYEVSKELFPQGLGETVRLIREAGMIPGIWFEIENVGRASRAYHMTDLLLHKDGKVLTSYFRRFWNMKDPQVEAYLTEKVVGTLKKYGFGYMKIDYNETIGIGCDGAESLGEGLRQNMEASVRFIEKVKREIPGIVLENCASGGHRLEPGMMARTSMASFSDAHECIEIPVIAAGLHRVIHPSQSQIWAVLRASDPAKRIVYSIASTFLGRMCISGDVTELTEEQWCLTEEGMEFYRGIAPIIQKGHSYQYGPKIRSYRHPEGWQAVIRVGDNGEAYAVIHVFGGVIPEQIELELPAGCPENVRKIYAHEAADLKMEGSYLTYRPGEVFSAVAVHLTL